MYIKASWIKKEWDYTGPAPVMKGVEQIVTIEVPDNSTKEDITRICMNKDVTLKL